MNSEGWTEYDPEYIFLKREAAVLAQAKILLEHTKAHPETPDHILLGDMSVLQERFERQMANDPFPHVTMESEIRESRINYLRLRLQNIISILETLIATQSSLPYQLDLAVKAIIIHFADALHVIFFSDYWDYIEKDAVLALKDRNLFDLFYDCANICFSFSETLSSSGSNYQANKSAISDIAYIGYTLFTIAESQLVKDLPFKSNDTGEDNWWNLQLVQEMRINAEQCYVLSAETDDLEGAKNKFQELFQVNKDVLVGIMLHQQFNSDVKTTLIARIHYNLAVCAYFTEQFEEAEIHAQAALDNFCFTYPKLTKIIPFLKAPKNVMSQIKQLQMRDSDINKVVHMVQLIDELSGGNQFVLEG